MFVTEMKLYLINTNPEEVYEALNHLNVTKGKAVYVYSDFPKRLDDIDTQMVNDWMTEIGLKE